jgi:signal transduction histidine kinase
LLVLDSKNADRRFDAPPAAIDDITVNGERTGSTSDIGALPPGRNNVAFRYTGLSFIVPTRITFKYTLEGFDAKWVDAGTRREAFYTNLPPGRFRFRVSACNLDGECHEAATAVAFVVEARYYQRAWFIPFCIVGAALVGLTGYRLRIRRLSEHFDLILAERSRIARELHDTLIQGFSGITMAMQALAARLPAPADQRALEQIVADAGTSLREARRSLSGLRSRPEAGSGLAVAIAHTSRQLTEARGIRLKLKVDTWDGTLPPDVEDNLLRIAQEAVLNAVKHSGARSLLVALERTANRVRLVIKDDGLGFDGRTAAQAGHYGVLGMRERAANIGAELSLDSTPGYGTAVSVTMEA